MTVSLRLWALQRHLCHCPAEQCPSPLAHAQLYLGALGSRLHSAVDLSAAAQEDVLYILTSARIRQAASNWISSAQIDGTDATLVAESGRTSSVNHTAIFKIPRPANAVAGIEVLTTSGTLTNHTGVAVFHVPGATGEASSASSTPNGTSTLDLSLAIPSNGLVLVVAADDDGTADNLALSGVSTQQRLIATGGREIVVGAPSVTAPEPLRPLFVNGTDQTSLTGIAVCII